MIDGVELGGEKDIYLAKRKLYLNDVKLIPESLYIVEGKV